jgi:hypothetical protein
MFIEKTFMRYGHAPGEVIAVTLKPDTLKVWALSLHTCSLFQANLDEYIYEQSTGSEYSERKEE